MNDSYQTNERFQAFLEEAKSLRSTIDQLKKLKSLEEVSNKMGLLDYAQLNASLAYSLSSMLKSCLFYFWIANVLVNMDINREPAEEERHDDEVNTFFLQI